MATRRRGFEKIRSEEGDEGIRRVALDYATTDILSKMEVVADRNDISDLGLREAIAYAIEHCLISYKLCLDCKNKAFMNQALHISNVSEAPALPYYDDLLKKRFEYVKKIRDERVLTVVQLYIRASRFQLSFVADALGYSESEIKVFLKNAIIFNLASDEDVERIIQIATRKAHYREKGKTVSSLQNLKEYRQTYKELLENIRYYEFRVSEYDSNDFGVEDAPSKSDLESRLESSRKALEDFEALF